MESLFFCDGTLAVLGTFDFSYLPQLLLYSFIPSTALALTFSIYIFVKDNGSTRATLLLFTALSFSLWTLNDTLQWITVPANLNLFFWQLAVLCEILVALALLSFVRVFSKDKQELSFFEVSILFVLIAPVLLFLPTTLNISAFDLTTCEGIVSPLIDYAHLIGIIASIIIFIQIIHLFILRKKHGFLERNKFTSPIITAIAALAFLSIFSAANIIGETTKTYVLGLIGPIGMNLFLLFLVYTIVKFKVFKVKLMGAQALVIILWALVGSLLFVVKSDTSRIIATATFVFTTFAGYLLVRSVKKEVQQREELEMLTNKLESANERLKELDKAKSEFVSIASHQLRSPLTAIRGYASMLAEGSFGQMPVKAQESAKRIEESAKLMAMSIEDYLNVSRIESGNMKYNLSDFNLVEMTSNLCDDLRGEAMSRNLILLFRSNVAGKGIVNADVGKTNQIIHNLINNSIKYTPKGSVSVFVRDDLKTKRIYIDITDTGIGMSQETISKLFGKFSRANNANSVNTSGTGLGLYVALKMAEAMGGSISCTSEGDGKGSTFTFELPLAM
jgi:signal transduction histidine kinase